MVTWTIVLASIASHFKCVQLSAQFKHSNAKALVTVYVDNPASLALRRNAKWTAHGPQSSLRLREEKTGKLGKRNKMVIIMRGRVPRQGH